MVPHTPFQPSDPGPPFGSDPDPGPRDEDPGALSGGPAPELADAGDVSPELRMLFAKHHTKLMSSARSLMRRQPAAHTLQPTALVNEVFLRLASVVGDFDDYGHFLRSAAKSMRHVLIDHHRARGATHRPGTCLDIELVTIAAPYEERAIDLAALDELLDSLAEDDPEAAQIVELRFFGGATLTEVADAMGIGRRTLDRRWAALKMLLHSRLS